MTSVLVTGAAGFVGSHVVERFAAERFSVWAPDVRLPEAATPAARASLDELRAHDRFRLADLTDPGGVRAMLDDIRPDGIVHAGGIVGPEAATANPRLAVQVNVLGTQNLLEYAKDHETRFTFLSTATIYGTDPQLRLLHEELPQALVAPAILQRDRRVELALRDGAELHEHVAEPVAAIHDRRVADAALVEIDVAEAVAMRDAQTARLLSHREELQHVREARLLEASTNRH